MFTVPVGEWFRTTSYAWLRDTLRGSGVLNRYFQQQPISAMLEQHRSGAANFTRELRALAALALWDAGREAQA